MRAAAAVLLALMPGAASGEARRFPRGFKRNPLRNVTHIPVAQLTAEEIAAAPTAHDWSKTACSPIKNQGDCGDCWAHAASETIESAVFMSTGKVPVLSTQQLTSCVDGGDEGCDGGDQGDAYDYVKKVGGIDSQADYGPYKSGKTGRTGKCTWDKKKVAKITAYGFAVPGCSRKSPPPDEDAMAAALVKYGPLSISVETSGWDNYKGGVLGGKSGNLKCSSKCNDEEHSPQLVGYDKGASPPYWKIRNSWGADWGEDGYIRVPWGVNACGVGGWVQWVQATTE